MTHQVTGRIGRARYPQLLAWIAEGMTAPEIGRRLAVDAETVRKFARRRHLLIEPEDQTGENHPSWKGGTTLDRSGYLLRRVAVDGPYGYLIRALQKRGRAGTDSQGYAPEHRIVMHDALGRRLKRGEVVDHIDGDKTNNARENLRVFRSNGDHLRETLKGRVPNWTADGKRRIREGVQRAVDRHAAKRARSKSDGQASR